MVKREELLKLLPVRAMGSHKSLMQSMAMGHDDFKTSLCKKNIQVQCFFNKNNKL
jgi:hypothetical protein